MLHFNRSGLLVPSSIIGSSLTELQTEFVTNIPTTERIDHFNAYIKYSDALKELCGNINLTQWINGSFVTRKSRPKDIDLVTFMDFKMISLLGNAIRSFTYPESEIIFQVDAYIVAVYPVDSKQHYLFQYDKAYWIDKFGKARRNRAGNKLSKGFLEIIY